MGPELVLMVVAAALLGAGIGTFTGLVPGIHVNAAATVLASGAPALAAALPWAVPDGMEAVFACCVIMSAASVHSFVDFVPSVFIGAPGEDDAVSVLPGHRMLREGRGMAAVRAAAIGSAVGAASALALAIPVQWLMLRGGSGILDAVTVGVVLFACAVVVLSARRRSAALALLLASGALGYAAMDMGIPSSGPLGEGTLLFPLLSGLFGIPPLLDAARGGRTPEQTDDGEDPVGPGPGLKGVATGLIAGWFPGITSTVGATIASAFGGERDPARFVSMTASIGTVTSVFALVSLSVTGSGRSGTAVAVKGIIGDALSGFCSEAFVLMLLSVAVASALGYALTIWSGAAMSEVAERVPADLMGKAVLALIVALVALTVGPWGLALLAISAGLGLVPPAVGTGRVCLAGCLLVPALLSGLGIVRDRTDYIPGRRARSG